MGSLVKHFQWIGLMFVLTQVPLLTSACLNELACSFKQPTVLTKSGPIAGVQTLTQDNKTLNVYYGIPFAQPPVKELRFRPPLPITPWNMTLDATEPPMSCYQQVPKEFRSRIKRPWTEDCLTLSIWTPEPKPDKAPVLVFIHGGAFVIGSSVSNIDGGRLASEGIVVVSTNYRLGVFGFLSLGTPEVPGNMGLMDQNMALQWVRDNIEAFGGDPEAVTLAGSSAGGMSVGLHLLSPMSRGLFKRAVLMSGVPIHPLSVRELDAGMAKSENVLDFLGCKLANASSALSCVQDKDPEDVLEAVTDLDILSANMFLPTVDGVFTVEHPAVSVSAGRLNPAEILIGSVTDDGADYVKASVPAIFKSRDGKVLRRDVLKVIKRAHAGMSDQQAEVLNLVYTDWSDPDNPLTLRDNLKDMYTDALVLCPTNEFAQSLARFGHSVYRYVFNYNMDVLKVLTNREEWVGASHGEDQKSVFAPPQLFQRMSARDTLVSNKMIQYLANFVKIGNPNLSNAGESKWPLFTAAKEYNLIDVTSSIVKFSRQKECTTWSSLMPILNQMKSC